MLALTAITKLFLLDASIVVLPIMFCAYFVGLFYYAYKATLRRFPDLDPAIKSDPSARRMEWRLNDDRAQCYGNILWWGFVIMGVSMAIVGAIVFVLQSLLMKT